MSNTDFEEMSHIGEFSRDGEYVKDYYVVKNHDTFHLFYNVGQAGPTQDWWDPGNEKAFGHSSTRDFQSWEHHPRVLPAIPGTWEGEVVSAPSIIRHEGLYHMIYTGFDDRARGRQSIGLATSADLFTWTRHPGNPVYVAPAWAERRPDGWVDCRDAHVISWAGEFLLFTMVTTRSGRGAIALASSPDLVAWTDLGPAVVTFKDPESPRVFEHDGNFFMFVTSSFGKQLLVTRDPRSNDWREVSFVWPSPGLWSGWEVTPDGERTIFSAFEWKPNGNMIRFWEVAWKDGRPSVRYGDPTTP